MSGIFGALDSRPGAGIDRLVTRMGSSLAHRPWYVVETWQDESAGVGLGRVGIGIFNHERQPVCSEDDSLVVFLSGELYNTSALRRELSAKGRRLRDDGDLELILHLYQDRGEQFVRHLDGVFVLAIWDRSRQELIVANDRAGLYPLHYTHVNGRLLFAPEMKAILSDPDFRKALDLTALAEYVRFQFLLGDKTFFADLKLLPNASLLRYSPQTDRLSIQPYWDFSEIPELPASLTFEDAVDEAGRRLHAAVNRLTGDDHRLGVYLSGGVDARAILGLIDGDRSRITTITFGQRNCRDAEYARQIARAAGARHHYFEFTDGRWARAYADFHLELTEGFHSWIHAHGISILGDARRLIEVNLTGLGGGQSYVDWEDPTLLGAQDDLAFSGRLFQLLSQSTTWPSIDEAEEKALYSPHLAPQLRDRAFESFRCELENYRHLPPLQRAAYFALCNPDRRLFQYYTVFQRSHVELRFPFFDRSYFEFVYALPPDMLYHRRLRRAIILKRMRPLARVPYDKDDLPITNGKFSWLTARLIHKSKALMNRRFPRAFPPRATLYADYENWLRGELRDWGEDLLLSERTLQREIFNPDMLRSLWRRHQSGLEVNFIGKIAPLMSYEMMLRRFYD